MWYPKMGMSHPVQRKNRNNYLVEWNQLEGAIRI